MYFIRTVDSIEEAEESLITGKSVDKWGLIGENAFSHFVNHPYNQRPIVFHKMGYNMRLSEEGTVTSESINVMEKMLSDKPIEKWNEQEIAMGLNLILLPSGGYTRYLDGLCSLQSFQYIPKPEECTATLPEGLLFPFLVCYEGALVGTDIDVDWDVEWELFKPIKIEWIHPTGSTNKRLIG